MANEIKVTMGLSATKGELRLPDDRRTYSVTMAGEHSFQNVQDIGTAYEAIALGADLGTPGIGKFRNLDPTNYVELAIDVAGTKGAFAKLLPGDPPACFPIGGTLYAKANVASIKLEVKILER